MDRSGQSDFARNLSFHEHRATDCSANIRLVSEVSSNSHEDRSNGS